MADSIVNTASSLLSDISNTSTVTSPGGGQPPSPSFSSAFHLFQVALSVQRICNPLLLSIGTLGNVMTVVIMRRLTSEDATIPIYFTAIAVADLLYLWTIVLEQAIFYNLRTDIKILHGVFCKVFTWLYTGGGTVSCWCLVCMTVHRALSVAWPHRVHVLCTRQRVVVMLTAVSVLIAVLYSHYLVGYDVLLVNAKRGLYRCTPATQDYINFHSNIFVYVELLVYSALPFMLIMCANGVLTWRLLSSAKRNLTEGSSAHQAQNREKAASSVTLTVMTVSLTFLVLTLPSPVNFLFNHFAITGQAQPSLSEWYGMLGVTFVCAVLGHSNHAVNFYLYCLTGRRFRQEFLRLLCCCGGSRTGGRGQRLASVSGKEASG